MGRRSPSTHARCQAIARKSRHWLRLSAEFGSIRRPPSPEPYSHQRLLTLNPFDLFPTLARTRTRLPNRRISPPPEQQFAEWLALIIADCVLRQDLARGFRRSARRTRSTGCPDRNRIQARALRHVELSRVSRAHLRSILVIAGARDLPSISLFLRLISRSKEQCAKPRAARSL